MQPTAFFFLLRKTEIGLEVYKEDYREMERPKASILQPRLADPDENEMGLEQGARDN